MSWPRTAVWYLDFLSKLSDFWKSGARMTLIAQGRKIHFSQSSDKCRRPIFSAAPMVVVNELGKKETLI
jgi:hypothetical protein